MTVPSCSNLLISAPKKVANCLDKFLTSMCLFSWLALPRTLSEVFYWWRLAGGDLEQELRRCGLIRTQPPITGLPGWVLLWWFSRQGTIRKFLHFSRNGRAHTWPGPPPSPKHGHSMPDVTCREVLYTIFSFKAVMVLTLPPTYEQEYISTQECATLHIRSPTSKTHVMWFWIRCTCLKYR